MINLWLILTKTARDTLLHLMSKTLFQQVLICTVLVILSGCLHNVDMETGEGCWRYGVAETVNTGRMTNTPISQIPVTRLNYDDLLIACNVEDNRTLAGFWMDKRTVATTACFVPRPVDGKAGTDNIYLHKTYAGKRDYLHEVCHIIKGRNHNCVYPHYAQWDKSEQSACNWKE